MEELIIDHALVGSADFRELQKRSPSMLGLGRPPYQVIIKQQEQSFSSSEELVKAVLEHGKTGLSIQRYKGLGEMNTEQLWETTMNPAMRDLMQVTLEDTVAVEKIFTTLMGDEVEPRRQFIQQHARDVKNLDV